MSLVTIAEQLAPELTAARAEGDEARRLPDAVWKALLESGILRCSQPARWGGGEVHLLEYVDAVMALSRACERVAESCVDLYRVASGRTAFLDHPLHTRFQDLQTGLGHAFLVPDPLAKAVGGELLGTEKPEFVL